MATQAELNNAQVAKVRQQLRMEMKGLGQGTKVSISGNQFTIEANQVVGAYTVGVTKAVGRILYDLNVVNNKVVVSNVRVRADQVIYTKNNVTVTGQTGTASFRMTVGNQELFKVDYNPRNASFTRNINKEIKYNGNIGIVNSSGGYTEVAGLYDSWDFNPTKASVSVRFVINNLNDLNVPTAPVEQPKGNLTIRYLDADTQTQIKAPTVITNLTPGSFYEANPETITGYVPTTGYIRVLINQGENNFVVYYKKNTTRLLVHYRLRSNESKLLDDQSIEVSIGSQQNLRASEIGNYYPEKYSDTVNITQENQEYTFYYQPFPKLIVKFKDKANPNGADIHTPLEVSTRPFTSASYTTPDIQGYTVEGATQRSEYLQSADKEVVVYYNRVVTTAPVSIRYIDRATGNEIDNRQEFNANIGTTLTLNAKPITGYDPENTQPVLYTVQAGENIVRFYYTGKAKIRPWAIRQSGSWKSLQSVDKWMKIRFQKSRIANNRDWKTPDNSEILSTDVGKVDYSPNRIRQNGQWKAQGRIGD